MHTSSAGPAFDEFMATAEAVARARPEVDLESAREVLAEAARLLHDGLALDGLDDHDTRATVDGLCRALVAEDPGAAVRALSRAASDDPGDLHDAGDLHGAGDLHDPAAVSAAYLVAAAVLQL